uniref:Uncharacterized protein n=1 Tax=Anguilla anguilla TaxID=7936 RepID=A0A0E9WUZ5_ANGAN
MVLNYTARPSSRENTFLKRVDSVRKTLSALMGTEGCLKNTDIWY